MSAIGSGATTVYRMDESGNSIERSVEPVSDSTLAGFAFGVTKEDGTTDLYLQSSPLGSESNWTFNSEDGLLEVSIKHGKETEFFQIYGIGGWSTVIGSPLMGLLLSDEEEDDGRLTII